MNNAKIIPFPTSESGKSSTASRPSRPVIVMPMRTVDVKAPAVGLLEEAMDWIVGAGSRAVAAFRRYVAARWSGKVANAVRVER